MNPWHDIEIERQLMGVIEIPTGSVYKYELEKKSGGLILDRVIPIGVPANYGFIPRTLSEDGDPLDVYILCDHPIVPLTQVKIELRGIILMTDNGENDEKLLAVIKGDQKIYDLDPIGRFLASYKPGIVVINTSDKSAAEKVLRQSKERYSEMMLAEAELK